MVGCITLWGSLPIKRSINIFKGWQGLISLVSSALFSESNLQTNLTENLGIGPVDPFTGYQWRFHIPFTEIPVLAYTELGQTLLAVSSGALVF